jgi:hypothetical protein
MSTRVLPRDPRALDILSIQRVRGAYNPYSLLP